MLGECEDNLEILSHPYCLVEMMVLGKAKVKL
jgi:hypothetical protein